MVQTILQKSNNKISINFFKYLFLKHKNKYLLYKKHKIKC